MRRLLSLSLALGLGLPGALAAPAFAGRNEITAGSSIRGLRSYSANAVTDDNLGGGAIGYARDLHLGVLPKLHLWARANLGWGGVQGEMFQTMSTDVGTFELTVGARARYELIHRIAASARLDLGMAKTSFTLTDPAGQELSDGGWAPIASAAVGLDLLAIDRRRFGLGIRAELGYVEAAAVPLSLASASSGDDTLHLPTTMASFGHLDLSGPTFTFAVVTQF